MSLILKVSQDDISTSEKIYFFLNKDPKLFIFRVKEIDGIFECACLPDFIETDSGNCFPCDELNDEAKVEGDCSCIFNAMPDDYGQCLCQERIKFISAQFL